MHHKPTHVTLLQRDVVFHTIPVIPHSVVSHFSLDVLKKVIRLHIHCAFMMPLTSKSSVMLDDAVLHTGMPSFSFLKES
jgi:hypothetical protein